MKRRRRTLALAGVFQGAALARSVAVRGRPDEEAMAVSIGSVLRLDADSVETVYGGVGGLGLGLGELSAQLSGGGDLRDLKPVIGLLALERQLHRRDDLLARLRSGVEQAARQAEHLGVLHDSVLLGLAELYRGTISTLRPRILVPGRPEYLNQNRLVAAIRAALLAGIRSAVLWRQVGGGRVDLLLRRGAYRRTAEELQAEANAHAGPGTASQRPD